MSTHKDHDEFKGDLLLHLANNIAELSQEVIRLRRDLASRPTAPEITQRRRRATAALLLYGILIIFAHDEHIESCSPGAQAEKIVQAIVDGDRVTNHSIKTIVEQNQPTAICDATFPFHHHGVNKPGQDVLGPFTGWNLVGLGFYVLLIYGFYLWQRPRRRD